MFRLTVEDIFRIKNRGVVATGRVESGAVRVGDTVHVDGAALVVRAIEVFRKSVDSASEGNVGLLFDDAAHDLLTRGAVITGDGERPAAPDAPDAAVEALAREVGLGGRRPARRWFGRS